MTRVFSFHGLKRSGNHALIWWLSGHFDGPMLLANDVTPNSVTKDRPVPSSALWRRKRNYRFRCKEGVDPQTAEVLMFSFEDKEPDFELGVPDLSFSVLRSFWNMAASRIAAPRQNPIPLTPAIVALWKAHADAYLHEISKSGGIDHIPILYDLWFSEPDYRREIEFMAGLREDDSELTTIPNIGLGSSFTGKTVYAQNMPVNERWKTVKRWPGFIWDDEELRALNQTIFGWNPGG